MVDVPEGAKILVCGGRDFRNWAFISETLTRLKPSKLIHGDAPGCDYLVNRWALENNVSVRFVSDFDIKVSDCI